MESSTQRTQETLAGDFYPALQFFALQMASVTQPTVIWRHLRRLKTCICAPSMVGGREGPWTPQTVFFGSNLTQLIHLGFVVLLSRLLSREEHLPWPFAIRSLGLNHSETGKFQLASHGVSMA